jgi:hypothetical protein
VRERRGHPAGGRREAKRRDARVDPHDAVRETRQARHLAAQERGIAAIRPSNVTERSAAVNPFAQCSMTTPALHEAWAGAAATKANATASRQQRPTMADKEPVARFRVAACPSSTGNARSRTCTSCAS